MHAPLHSLTNLRAIDQALADLINKHDQYIIVNMYRRKLARMIVQLRSEIAYRAAAKRNEIHHEAKNIN
jgi:hypothetical protein